MSTRHTLAVAGICAMVGLGVQLRAQQTSTPPSTPSSKPSTSSEAAGKTAVAKMMPTAGNNTRGEVTFTPDPKGGVHITGQFTGLAYGEHGFHIHEKGDCSAPDGSSAGGHFNPTSMKHGARDAQERHAGDLGNLKADPYGMARLDIVDDHLSFEGANSIIGKAVIIHEKVDDFTTQPTGNAGGRIACGVIEMKGATSPSSK
jgi:Cu-Zn family superoxide dismutase